MSRSGQDVRVPARNILLFEMVQPELPELTLTALDALLVLKKLEILFPLIVMLLLSVAAVRF
ncbi:MAG: hypothetical protein IPJ55_18015 [Chloracidobacterium sp.]|nr:hypothetical protein [Chloracidobacterium sp.]